MIGTDRARESVKISSGSEDNDRSCEFIKGTFAFESFEKNRNF